MGPETIFFSYSRTDSDFALRLAKDLREAGADIWMDQLDIGAGDRWDQTVEKALDDAKRVLVILTPESISSNNVMDEVSYALEQGKKVIPILLKPCNVSFRLRRLQQINFTGNYDEAFKRLLSELKLIEGKQEEKEERKDEGEQKRVEPEIKSKTKYKIPLLVTGGIIVLAVVIWQIMGGDSDNSEELMVWNKATESGLLEDYRDYQEKYPNGLHANSVKDSITNILDNNSWDEALRLDTKLAYQDYLDTHSTGLHREEANQKIAAIDSLSNVQNTPPDNQPVNRTTTSINESGGNTEEIPTLNIGDEHSGGIIFYVDNSGQHGLIASKKDIDGEFNWNNAKQKCAALGTGWRLPTKDELDNLCQKKDLVGGFKSKGGYWSATEIENEGKVWYQILRNCYQNEMTPDYLWHVRAVKAF